MSFLDKRRAAPAAAPSAPTTPTPSHLVQHPEEGARTLFPEPVKTPEVRRRGSLEMKTLPRIEGLAPVIAPSRVPDEKGAGTVNRTLRLSRALDDRMKTSVQGTTNAAIALLLTWALEELDRQNLTLQGEYISPNA